jgi:hypothetical protein
MTANEFIEWYKPRKAEGKFKGMGYLEVDISTLDALIAALDEAQCTILNLENELESVQAELVDLQADRD